MRTRLLAGAAVLLAVACGNVVSQPPPPAVPHKSVAHPAVPGFPEPARPVAPPTQRSIDQMLNDLETVRAQIVGLRKKEEELKKGIQKKLADQTERAIRLGAVVGPATEKFPDRVGRVMIEGADEKSEKKILAIVKFYPGQVLHYPDVETAQYRLHQVGYRSAEVIVVAGEDENVFKDIIVRVGKMN